MANYQTRFYQLLDYIDEYLDEELSVERLSQVACLSKYHFHRQFSALLGLSVSAYISQLRIKRASYQLAFRHHLNVVDIAVANGYDSAEAFSRAFRRHIGLSPSSFRAVPNWYPWHDKHYPLKQLRIRKMQQQNPDYAVKITEFGGVKVALLEHRGAPELLGDSIRRFIEWRKLNQLLPDISRTFNLVYDDPDTAEPKYYRFDLCAAINTDVEENEYGIVNRQIPAGRCALVRHIGSDDALGEVVNYLYSVWLEQSGEELRDFPLFFERIRFFPDVPEHEMITDIYLPLK